MDMGNAIEDSNSIFDTQERLVKELEEFQVTENFKSLFDIKKRLLDENGRDKNLDSLQARC